MTKKCFYCSKRRKRLKRLKRLSVFFAKHKRRLRRLRHPPNLYDFSVRNSTSCDSVSTSCDAVSMRYARLARVYKIIIC